MRLFSDGRGIDDHRVRLTLAEKGLAVETEYVDPDAPPEAVLQASPRGELPVLLDRDLALHGALVIVDYVDERYPHPPLLPMDPVSRARSRLALHRIETEWYAALPEPRGAAGARSDVAPVADLAASLGDADEVFGAMPFFLGESYSVLDAALAPLLWRLPHYGIVLPETAGSVADYARRMFARAAFRASLSPVETEMAR